MTPDGDSSRTELPDDEQPGVLDLPSGAEAALDQVRGAMAAATGLLLVAEAAALAMASLMSAWEVTISLIDGDESWDIVDVCREPEGWPRFPDFRYPLSDYPVGTERMLSGKGYISGNAAEEVMREIERQWPEVPVGSIMSAPIIALGGVHGEIFMVRDPETTMFVRDELDLASEMATLLGARLPALVSMYLDSTDTPSSSLTMPTLTHQLKEMLKDN